MTFIPLHMMSSTWTSKQIKDRHGKTDSSVLSGSLKFVDSHQLTDLFFSEKYCTIRSVI